MGRIGESGRAGVKGWRDWMGRIGEMGALLRVLPFLPLLPFVFVQPALAQSPNTSTIVVLVRDQSGAIIKDAIVSVINDQTGAVRETISGDDGSATVAALSLTGTYAVKVSLAGFTTEQRKDIVLRAGETAT